MDILPDLELIVDYDLWMQDTSEIADYVLPDCTTLEKWCIVAGYGHVILNEPAIEPLGECRDAIWVTTELAKRLGLGEYFDKTPEEWCEWLLTTSPDPAVKDITWERLKNEKFVRADVPQYSVNPAEMFMDMGLETHTGRLEFYQEDFADLNEPMASYVPSFQVNNQERRKEYPLQLFSGRQRFFMQSFYADDPLWVELSGGEPMARLNPLDAVPRGIEDGDIAEAFNDQGSMRVKCKLEESVPPGTFHIWFGWKARNFIDHTTYNDLLPDIGSARDDLCKRSWDLIMEKEGMGFLLFGGESGTGGNWDTLWDALCEVRKAPDQEGA